MTGERSGATWKVKGSSLIRDTEIYDRTETVASKDCFASTSALWDGAGGCLIYTLPTVGVIIQMACHYAWQHPHALKRWCQSVWVGVVSGCVIPEVWVHCRLYALSVSLTPEARGTVQTWRFVSLRNFLDWNKKIEVLLDSSSVTLVPDFISKFHRETPALGQELLSPLSRSPAFLVWGMLTLSPDRYSLVLSRLLW